MLYYVRGGIIIISVKTIKIKKRRLGGNKIAY